MNHSYMQAKKGEIFTRIGLYLLIPFSGFYTVKFGYSPIYLTFAMGVFAVFTKSLSGIRSWQQSFPMYVSIILLTYITVLLLLGWDFGSQIPSAWINLAFSVMYFLAVIAILGGAKYIHVLRAYEIYIILSIILLILELGYRVTHPQEPEAWQVFQEEISWYIYKTSSFMYPDSNSVGLFVSCLMAFIIGLPSAEGQKFKKYLLPLLVILFGTLSRAAIISTILVFLYCYLTGGRGKIIVLSAVIMLAATFLFLAIESDESFLSKFWIAGLVVNYIESAEIQSVLIGVGPGNAESAIGVGAHLLPFTLLIEIGAVGTLIVMVLWKTIWKGTGVYGTPLFFAILLNGLSFSTFAIPWFYAMAAGLIYFARVSKRNESFSSCPRL